MEKENERGVIETLLEAGDERCMELVFERDYRALCVHAARYPLSAAEVEDVVQSVLVSFWTNKQGRPFSGTVRAYLFGAVSKAALQWVRDNGKVYFEDIESYADTFLDEIFNPEEEERCERVRERLFTAVDRLADKPKRVLKAIVLEEKSYKEVAEEMNITVNTVKTYYARALQTLRKSLDKKSLLLLSWLTREKSV